MAGEVDYQNANWPGRGPAPLTNPWGGWKKLDTWWTETGKDLTSHMVACQAGTWKEKKGKREKKGQGPNKTFTSLVPKDDASWTAF